MSRSIWSTLKWLGKKNVYHESHTSDYVTVLDQIPRSPENVLCYGQDIWLCYEISWIRPSGKPVYKIGELTIPVESKYIIESKSLKLYLNQFNFLLRLTTDPMIIKAGDFIFDLLTFDLISESSPINTFCFEVVPFSIIAIGIFFIIPCCMSFSTNSFKLNKPI